MSLIKEKKMMIYNILDFMLPFILGFWVGIFLKNKGAIYALVFGLTINVFTFIFSLTFGMGHYGVIICTLKVVFLYLQALDRIL